MTKQEAIERRRDHLRSLVRDEGIAPTIAWERTAKRYKVSTRQGQKDWIFIRDAWVAEGRWDTKNRRYIHPEGEN